MLDFQVYSRITEKKRQCARSHNGSGGFTSLARDFRMNLKHLHAARKRKVGDGCAFGNHAAVQRFDDDLRIELFMGFEGFFKLLLLGGLKLGPSLSTLAFGEC